MTRQNVTDGPREILTRKCPVCEGDGIVVSDQTWRCSWSAACAALPRPARAFRRIASRCTPASCLLAGPGGARLAEIEDAAKRRFFLVPAENGHIHTDHFEVLAEGKLADLQPAAPVVEGGQLDVKLVEVGLYDAGAGVGKLDGLDVVVADAAKLVGKKANVVVGRVLDGQVFASLPSGEVTESPITFESEAEKPTRAPARRKPAAEPDMQSEAALEEELELETELVGDVESAETRRLRRRANGDETARRRRERAVGREEAGGARRSRPTWAAPAVVSTVRVRSPRVERRARDRACRGWYRGGCRRAGRHTCLAAPAASSDTQGSRPLIGSRRSRRRRQRS